MRLVHLRRRMVRMRRAVVRARARNTASHQAEDAEAEAASSLCLRSAVSGTVSVAVLRHTDA